MMGRFTSYQTWEGAKRFELEYPTIYALNNTSKLLINTGIDRIRKHVLMLNM